MSAITVTTTCTLLGSTNLGIVTGGNPSTFKFNNVNPTGFYSNYLADINYTNVVLPDSILCTSVPSSPIDLEPTINILIVAFSFFAFVSGWSIGLKRQ